MTKRDVGSEDGPRNLMHLAHGDKRDLQDASLERSSTGARPRSRSTVDQVELKNLASATKPFSRVGMLVANDILA